MKITILPFDTIPSTNIEAISQAKRGAQEGLCVTAQRQTAGRGRHGRLWESPENAGLYLSIVLRPKIEMRLMPLITFVGAIAVFETLTANYQMSPDIKWANDVLVNNRKISGVLAETAETTSGVAVILGIGINISSSALSPQLNSVATSIETEYGSIPGQAQLLESVISKVSEFYRILTGPKGDERIRDLWSARSSFAFGMQVNAVMGAYSITGLTCGIEENGALRIETETGGIIAVQAGDVERLRQKTSI